MRSTPVCCGNPSERGAALAVVIIALAVLSALVGGAFVTAMHEQRLGRGAFDYVHALHAAESGVAVQLSSWDARAYTSMAIGSSVRFSSWMPDSVGWYRGSLRRITRTIYFIDTEGFSRDSVARQHVGVLARLAPVEILVDAALRTHGELTVDSGAVISGIDANPVGWSGCPTLSDTVAGVQNGDSLLITSLAGGVIEGMPTILEDTALTDTGLMTFGAHAFADLRSYASHSLRGQDFTNAIGPYAAGGVCDEGLATNWGEPSSAVPECADYFPVIYLDGSSVVSQGRGQGILIVNGNLDVQGGFVWAGPILVRNAVTVRGTATQPTTIWGWVSAANPFPEHQRLAGSSRLQYSSCAVLRATEPTAVARPLKLRSWVLLP